jgi:hypothetical protein
VTLLPKQIHDKELYELKLKVSFQALDAFI